MDSVLLTAVVAGMCSSTGKSDSLKELDSSRACRFGIEATFRQTGIYDNVRTWEKRHKKNIEKTAKAYLKDEEGKVVAGFIVLTSLGFGNKAMFRLGKGRLGESYHTEVSTDEILLGVGWDF